MSTMRRSRSPQRPKNVAIVLCAGQGSRMGAGINKLFLPLLGKPLFVYSIESLARAREIDEILLVAHRLEVRQCESEIVQRYQLDKVSGVVVGGQSRHQSEFQALEALRPRIDRGEIGIIMIHDGARPILDVADIRLLTQAARTYGGAILAMPLRADQTIAQVTSDGTVTTLLPSSEYWRAMTPQAFDARMLLQAYDQAQSEHFEGTDTSMSVERAGQSVHVVQGRGPNLKITTPEDLLHAERLVRQRGWRA